MHAILLAAGVGKRLSGLAEGLPKCLLAFNGKTLLARHVEALAACGVARVDCVVGYRKDDVARELADAARRASIDCGVIENPQYDRGSIVSLSVARDVFTQHASIVMDADVLYQTGLLRRLIDSPHANCLLLDERAAPDEEAMRLGVDQSGSVRTIQRGLVDGYPLIGEGVGFLKLSPAVGVTLATALTKRLDRGLLDADYELAIDDMLQSERVFAEPVAPFAWTEIDFAEDVRRAEQDVLPLLDSDD